MTDLKQYRISREQRRGARRGIEAGGRRWASSQPGERLPSVRRLAAEVGAQPGDRRGRRWPSCAAAASCSASRGAERASASGRRSARTRAPLPVPPGARDLSRGNPDPALLPDLERALRRLERCPRACTASRRRCPSWPSSRASSCAPTASPARRCASSAARSTAIERVLEAHLRPGDRVAVENPGYAALFDLLRAHGLALEPVAVDERGMLPDALAGGARARARAPS